MPKFGAQIDTMKIPVKGLTAEQISGSDVSSPAEGEMWTRTDTHLLRIYLNSVIKTLATTDDTRFTDSRTPSGSAGGDLTGTYPSPTVANLAITAAKLAAALKPSGTAVDATEALRALGFTTGLAMPGTARLDQLAVPTANVSINGNKLTGVLDGTNSTDAVNLQQLQNAIAGFQAKLPVIVASTANVTLGAPIAMATFNSAMDGGGSISASPGVLGTRVMLKNQTAPAENGIYEVTNFNTGVSVTLSRSSDMDAWSEVPAGFVFVEKGNTQADTGWLSTADLGGTLGTTAITWVQFSAAGQLIDGAGLTKTGNTFDVNVDNSSLEIFSDALRVKALGITNSMIAAGTIDLTTKVTGTLPITKGGTGGATAPAARTALAVPGYAAPVVPALVAGTFSADVSIAPLQADNITGITFMETATNTPIDIDWKVGTSTTDLKFKADVAFGVAALSCRVDALG